MFDSMNAVIAALALCRPTAAGLADFGRPGNYMARQIGRWSKHYQASEPSRSRQWTLLIEWLPPACRRKRAPRIVHGDYRMDNLSLP